MRGGAPSRSAARRVRAGEPPAAPPAHASRSWLGPPAQAHFWGSTETNTNVVYASPSAPVCGRALPPGRFPDVGCPRVTGTGRSRKRCRPQGTAFWAFSAGKGQAAGGEGRALPQKTPPPTPRVPAGERMGGQPAQFVSGLPLQRSNKGARKNKRDGN